MFSQLLRHLTAPAPPARPESRVALAALLVRLARADGIYAPAEAAAIDRLLAARFALSPFAAAALRIEGEVLEADAADTVQFTRALKDAVPLEQRSALMETLWSVVLADGNRAPEEEAVMRMVASLLGLSDRDSALARQRAAGPDGGHAVMIASLPMYDPPPLRDANDAFWGLIRDRLRALGIAAPDALTRTGEMWDHWTDPALVLSQTCGLPYRARLHGQVTLVGSPDFGVPGCPPGHYRSVFVVRRGNPRRGLADFDGAVLAWNDALSQSGWAAPQNEARMRGLRFATGPQTGGHALSARAVADGRADIASLDAVTWANLQTFDPVCDALVEIDRTEPTPVLPYISARGADGALIRDAIAGAIAALPDGTRQRLRLKGIVAIPAECYLRVPIPPAPARPAHGG